jgi:acylphosphatase
MKKIVRAHLYISGIVQGVFFRTNTQDIARSLNLIGCVRNLRDGRVEIITEGQKDKIEQFIQWCHKGPPGAIVDNVEIEWMNATNEFKDFETRYRF